MRDKQSSHPYDRLMALVGSLFSPTDTPELEHHLPPEAKAQKPSLSSDLETHKEELESLEASLSLSTEKPSEPNLVVLQEKKAAFPKRNSALFSESSTAREAKAKQSSFPYPESIDRATNGDHEVFIRQALIIEPHYLNLLAFFQSPALHEPVQIDLARELIRTMKPQEQQSHGWIEYRNQRAYLDYLNQNILLCLVEGTPVKRFKKKLQEQVQVLSKEFRSPYLQNHFLQEKRDMNRLLALVFREL